MNPGERSPHFKDFVMRRSFPRSPLFAGLIVSGVCSCTPVGDAPDVLVDWSRVTASPARREPVVDPMHPRRNVIIVIGDGMQLAHEVATSRYLYGTDDGLSFHSLPTRLFKTTWDVNVYNSRASSRGVAFYTPDTFDPMVGYDLIVGGEAPYPILPDNPERRAYFLSGIYPDSASTATAMSTGIKTDSSNIAWFSGDPLNGALATTPQLLRRRYGMSVGFITTGPISHATPSGWFAHNPDRFSYLALAKEILLETRPDVVIGGGLGPEGGGYVDPADVDAALGTGDWWFVKRAAGVDGAESLLDAARGAREGQKRLLAFYGGTGGNFESPVPSDSPGAPSIARGSTENPRFADGIVAALERLSDNPKGFFLLAEQADIDWANHANNFPRMIGCVSDLSEGVQAILDYVDRPGDEIDWANTTLVVTADHANSYLRLEKVLGPGALPSLDPLTGTYPEISYGTGSHTAELVTVYAKGLAASFLEESATAYPGQPIIDDTSIYAMTLEAVMR
jgi:alkaline phosphatase